MVLKRYIVLTILTLAASLARAQMVFEPAEYDFGAIDEEGGRVSCTFTGVNRSDKPLVLLDVVTSCGCTVPEFSRQPVMPGGKTSIRVTFDPMNRPGTFSKEIGVYTTDRRKAATLTIRGSVTPRVRSLEELYPIEAGGGLRLSSVVGTFTYIYKGRRASIAIGCANTSDRTLLLELRSTRESGFLQVTAPQRIAPGQRGSFDLSYLVPAESPRYGTLEDALEVYIDGRSTGTLLTTHGIAVDDPAVTRRKTVPKAQLSENILKFGAVKRRGGPVRRTFTLSNEGPGELIVRAVETAPGIDATLRAGQRLAPGAEVRGEISFDPAHFDYGIMTDRVILVTNDPERPMRRLRVTAVIEQ